MAIKSLTQIPPGGGELLDLTEAQVFTGMSKTAIYRAMSAKSNPFPARRQIPGGGKRFRRSEIERWMNKLAAVESDRT